MARIYCSVGRPNWYSVYIEYSASTSGTQTTISHALYVEQLTDEWDFKGNFEATYYVAGQRFSGRPYINMDDKGNAGYRVKVLSGTTVVSHDSTTGDGYAVFSCTGLCESGGFGPGNISLGNTTVSFGRVPVYSLSISAGSNSGISVTRTSTSGNVSLGRVYSGTNNLCYGDALTISFSASPDYILTNHNVNGSPFTSGNSYTVLGNVMVESSAIVSASKVKATDASIGSVSIITVQKGDVGNYHSLKYKFGSKTGYISPDGSPVSSEMIYQNSSISFTIPENFYDEIPNTRGGSCEIECVTYKNSAGSVTIGAPQKTSFAVSIVDADCVPEINVVTTDINEKTSAITESPNIIIRYCSDVKVDVTVTTKHGAGINYCYVNNIPIELEELSGFTNMYKGTVIFGDFAKNEVNVDVLDSRTFYSTKKSSFTLIEYIPLTCNAYFSRSNPTENKLFLAVEGNMYRGSFGFGEDKNNSLKIEYQYKEKGNPNKPNYSNWKQLVLDPANMTYTTNSYRTNTPIELVGDAEGFSYNKEYIFNIRAKDGVGVGTSSPTQYPLSIVDKTGITVKKGVPVFDWGEKDFNFNVSVKAPYLSANTIEASSIRESGIDVLVAARDAACPVGGLMMRDDNLDLSRFPPWGTWERVGKQILPGIEGSSDLRVTVWKRKS